MLPVALRGALPCWPSRFHGASPCTAAEEAVRSGLGCCYAAAQLLLGAFVDCERGAGSEEPGARMVLMMQLERLDCDLATGF